MRRLLLAIPAIAVLALFGADQSRAVPANAPAIAAGADKINNVAKVRWYYYRVHRHHWNCPGVPWHYVGTWGGARHYKRTCWRYR